MGADAEWARVAAEYLASHAPGNDVATLVRRLSEVHPIEITDALAMDRAEAAKPDATAFLLFAIRHAVADHALSDDEVSTLRHLARVLRVQEGDLLTLHGEEVSRLLSQEFERLLEDRTIDPVEAVHKVKLQELLGVGYDEFVALTRPVIENVIVDLIRELDPDPVRGLTEGEIHLFHQRLAALDSVYDLSPRTIATGGRSGYLYLLLNQSMPGLIKVGRTARAPDQRVAELTSATGVPTLFILVYDLFVLDAVAAERYVHAKFEELGLRVAENREFFAASPSAAVTLMLKARDVVATV